MKRAQEVEQKAPSLCARKQPPPADRPALLRQWCRCAGVALAFVSACTGAQLRPRSGDACPDEALAAMRKLELPISFDVTVDPAQPYISGAGKRGVFKEGPVTSVVYEDVGKLPKGSRLFGERIGPFPDPDTGGPSWMVLYTRLQRPGEKAVPVCMVLGFPDGILTWFEGSRPGAAIGNKVEFVTPIARWPEVP